MRLNLLFRSTRLMANKILKIQIHLRFYFVDWMAACAAMTLIALFASIGATGMGFLGLFTHNRMSYIVAGALCVFGGKWCEVHS